MQIHLRILAQSGPIRTGRLSNVPLGGKETFAGQANPSVFHRTREGNEPCAYCLVVSR
jgi:hypothetical protein